MTNVVDTNVILVANGQHGEVSPECVAECALRLQQIMRNGRIAIDDQFLILHEYQNKTSALRGRGPGDAFVKWALQNNANSARCDQVSVSAHERRGFAEFPDDERLSDVDAADRKFIAVAAAHAHHPAILEATDSKWLDWAPILDEYEITIDFVCPADIRRFHESKNGT